MSVSLNNLSTAISTLQSDILNVASSSSEPEFFQQVACGFSHFVAINPDKTVSGTGRSSDGQLGNGNTYNIDKLNLVKINETTNLENVKAVYTGLYHTMFLINDGSVYACGDNTYGQLGIDNVAYPISNYAIKIFDSSDGVRNISAGAYHTMFLMNDGSVKGCGLNTNGQLGNGLTTNSYIFVNVNNVSNVKKVYCGAKHTIFLLNDDTVMSCGKNNNGQLGDNTIIQKSIPVMVVDSDGNNLSNIKDIAAGAYYTIFLDKNNKLYCSGTMLINHNKTNYASLYFNSVSKIYAGYFCFIIMYENLIYYGYGLNANGMFGITTNINEETYDIPLEFNSIDYIALGFNSSISLSKSGFDYTISGFYIDKNVLNLTLIMQGIIAGYDNYIVDHKIGEYIYPNKAILNRGNGTSGQLGNGTSTSTTDFTAVNNGFLDSTNIIVEWGLQVSYYLDTVNGNMWFAGNENNIYALTGNDESDISGINKVNYFSDRNIKIISIKMTWSNYTYYLSDTGKLYYSNNLTTPEIILREFTIGSGILLKAIWSTQFHIYGIDFNDNLWWVHGDTTANTRPQGLSGVDAQLEPFTQTNNINIVYVVGSVPYGAANFFAFFLASNGDVYAHGVNTWGCLGLGNTNNFLGLTKVDYFTTNNIRITDIKISSYSTAFLADNGDVYTTGWGTYGQLGLGDKLTTRTPTKIQYFTTYNITIVKICGDMTYQTIYYLASNGDLYASGNHYNNGITSQFSIPTLYKTNIKDIYVSWSGQYVYTSTGNITIILNNNNNSNINKSIIDNVLELDFKIVKARIIVYGLLTEEKYIGFNSDSSEVNDYNIVNEGLEILKIIIGKNGSYLVTTNGAFYKGTVTTYNGLGLDSGTVVRLQDHKYISDTKIVNFYDNTQSYSNTIFYTDQYGDVYVVGPYYNGANGLVSINALTFTKVIPLSNVIKIISIGNGYYAHMMHWFLDSSGDMYVTWPCVAAGTRPIYNRSNVADMFFTSNSWSQPYAPSPIIIYMDGTTSVAAYNNIGFISKVFSPTHNGSFMFLTNDGDVYSMGANTFGQLGIGTFVNVSTASTPVRIDYFYNNNIKIEKIYLEVEHSVFVATNGDIYACGKNEWYGGLVNGGTAANNSTPVNLTVNLNINEEIRDISLTPTSTLLIPA